MSGRIVLFLLFSWFAGPVFAAGQMLPDVEAARLLRRVAQAPQKVSFQGIYVQQYGDALETIHVCHLVEGDKLHERRDTQDGPLREMVRHGEEVHLFMPGSSADTAFQPDGHLFPALLPNDPAWVLQSYSLRKLGRERVAGQLADVYDLLPRDDLRFAHRLWVHVPTGLLLKASTRGRQNEPYELFAFSQLQVGGSIDRNQLQPASGVKPQRLVRPKPDEAMPSWLQRNTAAVPSGFRLIRQQARHLPSRGQPVVHHVYSDGVVAVSIFAEPGKAPAVGNLSRQGALNVYMQQAGDIRLTVVGEVPPETLERFARIYQ